MIKFLSLAAGGSTSQMCTFFPPDFPLLSKSNLQRKAQPLFGQGILEISVSKATFVDQPLVELYGASKKSLNEQPSAATKIQLFKLFKSLCLLFTHPSTLNLNKNGFKGFKQLIRGNSWSLTRWQSCPVFSIQFTNRVLIHGKLLKLLKARYSNVCADKWAYY